MKSNDFCGHYICKIIWAYIALCFVAFVAYFVIAGVAGLDLTDGPNKVTLIASLIAWTGAMIVPIAAGFAISDWREQQKFMDLYHKANHLLEMYTELQIIADSILYIVGEEIDNLKHDRYESHYGDFEIRRRQDENYFNKNLYNKHAKKLLIHAQDLKTLFQNFYTHNKIFCILTEDENLSSLTHSFKHFLLSGIEQFEKNALEENLEFDMYLGYFLDDIRKIFYGGTFEYIEKLEIYLNPKFNKSTRG